MAREIINSTVGICGKASFEKGLYSGLKTLLGYYLCMTQFAIKLKEWRARAGLTQLQLSKKAGLHLSAITKLEQGQNDPSLETALAIAKALGQDCGALSKPAESVSPPAPKRGRPAPAKKAPRKKKAK